MFGFLKNLFGKSASENTQISEQAPYKVEPPLPAVTAEQPKVVVNSGESKPVKATKKSAHVGNQPKTKAKTPAKPVTKPKAKVPAKPKKKAS